MRLTEREDMHHQSLFKYFEPGHTFMSADNFHHQVERRMRQKKNVEDFQDFVDVVSTCGHSFAGDEMQRFFRLSKRSFSRQLHS